MSATPRAVLHRLHQAMNRHDLDAFVACFAPDAHVHDESRDYRGHDEIRSWKQGTMEKYTYTIEPLKLTRQGEQRVTLEAKLAGNFPGSPVTLRFAFTLAADGIAALEIG